MGLIVDTCIFIQAEKQDSQINFNQWLDYGSAYITAITASELLVGAYRAYNEKRKFKRMAFVENILASFPILDFTLETARIHAEIFAFLRKEGQEIGAHDLIISAIALTHDFAVLSQNQHEFARVPGLKLLTC